MPFSLKLYISLESLYFATISSNQDRESHGKSTDGKKSFAKSVGTLEILDHVLLFVNF